MNFALRSMFLDIFDSYGYWKRKAYFGLFCGTFVYIYTGHFKHQCIDHGNPAGITEFSKIRLCWSIFGRSRSRWFGYLMERPVPSEIRPDVYRVFAKILGIDLSEAKYPIKSYRSLAHLFARTLKEGLRPIAREDDSDSLVVPCDGEIVNLAEIGFNDERITQLDVEGLAKAKNEIAKVKGATFRVESFLGFDPRFNSRGSLKPSTSSDAGDTEEKETKLVYAVIYLAPRDYHHFHSPCEMGIQMRRHMPGMTLPVFKGLASRLNDMFSINERIVMSGRWKYGQIHYAAVAAYNVGNIRLKYEPNFRTNQLRTELYCTKRVMTSLSYEEPDFEEELINPIERSIGEKGEEKITAHWFSKGERVGEFRLGSTIVVILEVPKNFSWDVAVGDQVRMGQLLGHVN